jgi:hypothetical protein
MRQLAEIKVVSPNRDGRARSRQARSQGLFGTFVPNSEVYLRILENLCDASGTNRLGLSPAELGKTAQADLMGLFVATELQRI